MTKPLFAAMLTLAFVAGCSGEADGTQAGVNEGSTAAASAESGMAKEAQNSVETPAQADWSGINDQKVRAAIDAKLDSFYKENGERFGLLVVDELQGSDRFGAAGIAAMDLGTPAIVVATRQKDIQIVGDEALAYFQEDRARIAKETGEFFDRGEFEQGIEHALDQIVASWQGG